MSLSVSVSSFALTLLICIAVTLLFFTVFALFLANFVAVPWAHLITAAGKLDKEVTLIWCTAQVLSALARSKVLCLKVMNEKSLQLSFPPAPFASFC